MPIYVKAFVDPIKKSFKKSIIFINERLPLDSFNITIVTCFDSKKEKEAALEMVARLGIESDDDTLTKKIKTIIGDEKKSFNRKLDEILNLKSESTEQPDYSYCLCCGEKIMNKRKFCNATKSSKRSAEDRDNCLRLFTAWIKSRLGIVEIEENKERREQLYKEMLMLVKKYRFSAYEQFNLNHPEIFTSKKRGRKSKKENSN